MTAAAAIRPVATARLDLALLLPFGVGYLLAYALRNLNALLAEPISRELSISPTALGLLSAALFLAMALVQLPLATALDRHGPARVALPLLVVAAVGAAGMALADGTIALVLGRSLVGLGTAACLMAALKAAVLSTPPARLATANGLIVMLGGLGAVLATLPAERLLLSIGWRALLWLCAGLFLLAAAAVAVTAARLPSAPSATLKPRLRQIYADPRMQRIAPLSMLLIGSSWSLQSLWAAPWLSHVAGLKREAVVLHLLAMALALAAAAPAIGHLADRLHARGISRANLLALMAAASLAATLALALRLELPPLVPWLVIAAAGAATTLSYAILPGVFAKAISARANAALNLLHLGAAFLLQLAVGAVLDHGRRAATPPAPEAFSTALLLLAGLQGLGLAWFLLDPTRPRARLYRSSQGPASPYAAALGLYAARLAEARQHAFEWRLAALAAIGLALLVALAASAPAQTQLLILIEPPRPPLQP